MTNIFQDTFLRSLASGAVAEARCSDGLVVRIFPADEVGPMEGPTCPICDALNCGGDGNGCYQYEGRGRWDPDAEYERQMEMYDVGLRS